MTNTALWDERPDLIEPGVFLSSARAESSPAELLTDLGITHILQVGAELEPSHPGRFAYKRVPLYDKEYTDLIPCIPAAVEFINAALAAGKNVLVHCAAGVSRSASVVTAHQMVRHGLSLEQALMRVRRARPGVLPNKGFLCQLLEFERAGCSAVGWPGWGSARWLEHPLAGKAHSLYNRLLGPAAYGDTPDSWLTRIDAIVADLDPATTEAHVAACKSESPFASSIAADLDCADGETRAAASRP